MFSFALSRDTRNHRGRLNLNVQIEELYIAWKTPEAGEPTRRLE
jgi:hypothetical protein